MPDGTEFVPPADLVQRIQDLAKDALNVGWDLTKKAAATTSTEEKTDLTAAAETAYRGSLGQMYRIIFDKPTFESLRELEKQILAANINVFDLYRRVGRLEDAEELGKHTLEQTLMLADTDTTLRAGNFLTLVHSFKAYRALEKKDFAAALNIYLDIENTFKSLPLEQAKGKTAVMLYGNFAVNYLNKFETSRKIKPSKIDASELGLPYQLTQKALSSLDQIKSPQDRANWEANLKSVLGRNYEFSGDHHSAIKEYTEALDIAKNAHYPALTAGIHANLAYVYVTLTNPNPNFTKAREHFKPVQEFLKTKNFGGDNTYHLPRIEIIKERLHISLSPQLI